jgi:hypothetical protein
MLDDLIDQAIEKTLERAGVMCSDEERMDRVYDKIVAPIAKYIGMKASWLIYTMECLASLIVVQTILLVILIQCLR